MAAPPYMKLYVGDYHGDTTHLTTVEHGAYLLLLMAMWRAGGKLPRDDKRMAALTKLSASDWAEIKATIMEFFTVSGGSVSHKRIVAEMAKYETVVEKRSKAGKASAAKKANENNEKASTHVEQVLNTCSHNQNQNQNHLKKENTTYSPKKGTRLSGDWIPTPADQSFALTHLTSEGFRHEADQFRDYWIAKPGAAGVKLDWPATWRTWVRRAGKGSPMAQRKNTGTGGRADTSFADVRARRRAERGEGVEIPGGEASVSGCDFGWSDGAIDGQLAESHSKARNGHDAGLPFRG